MNHIRTNLTIIGGGPAGLAAALEAKRTGIEDVTLIERDTRLGGVLQQCIHDGFGIQRFNQRMPGSMYAQKFIDELNNTDVRVLTDTMVMDLSRNKEIYATNKDGIIHIESDAVILAMGCRERPASQVFIHGYRPAGVMTAGSVQRYINLYGYLPGTRAVILGSGDIGMIMARRMTLEGIEVEGVYELMSAPGGLSRNIEQCLNDFDIPLHLSTTVTKVFGKHRIEGVLVAEVDEKKQIIKETERYIPCDLLVLAVGLIPENELSKKGGVEIDSRTKGPIVDSRFMTSVPGIFAAGNVAAVFDLVDYVSLTGEIAARGAGDYIRGKITGGEELIDLTTRGNISFAIPQKIVCSESPQDLHVFMRVKHPQTNCELSIDNGSEIKKKRIMKAMPAEMLTWKTSITTTSPVKINVD